MEYTNNISKNPIVMGGFILIFVGIVIFLISKIASMRETYSNYNLGGASGKFPTSETELLLQGSFPLKGRGVSDNQSIDIWKDYPIFEVGSYAQTTNNIRYPRNPDDGRCMPASFCDALYSDRPSRPNNVTPLPPVSSISGARVGYYSTNDNLLTYKTDGTNILY